MIKSTDLAVYTLDCPQHDSSRREEKFRNDESTTTDTSALSPFPQRALEECLEQNMTMLSTILPLTLTVFLTHIPTLTTTIMCDHLNSTMLQRSATTAFSTSHYIGVSVLLGFMTALECLGSQAEGSRYLGLITARTSVIGLSLTCLLVTALFYSESVIRLLPESGPHAEDLALQMLRVYSLILPFLCVDMTLTRYSIILGHVTEIIYLRLGIVILHATLAYLLIFSWHRPLIGAVIALLVSEICVTVLTVALIRHLGILREVTCHLNIGTLFKGWGEILKLGIPGIVMFITQTILVGATLSGLAKHDAGEYHSFADLLQYQSVYSYLYHGLAVAGTIATGRGLGRQDAGATKRNTTLFSWFSLVCGFIFVLISLLFRHQIAYFMPHASSSMVITSIPMFCVYLAADTAQVSMYGVLRGLGKHVLGCALYLVSLCGVGLLSTLMLVDVFGAGASGAWLSLALGSGLALVGVWMILMRTDWVKETRSVMEMGGMLDKECIEMQVLGEEENRMSDINPFTNEVFETVPLFTKQTAVVPIDNEVKITISWCVVSFLIMIISVAISLASS